MERVKTITYLVIVIAILLASTSCSGGSQTPVTANTNVINFKDFSLNTESIGKSTTARGTIMLMGNGDIPNQARIIVWVNIDRKDEGGVGFGIPAGWNVNEIVSSYPTGFPDSDNTYIITDSGGSPKNPYYTYVRIGSMYGHTGGGQGMVTITLENTVSGKDAPDYLAIRALAGSQVNQGTLELYPIWEDIQVPFKSSQ